MKDIELLSEKRFDEVKELFIKYDIGLSEKCILLYANAFEWLSRVTHGKLSTEQLLRVYVFTSEWLEEHIYNCHSKDEKSISKIIEWLEICCDSKGRLTDKEKEEFAVIFDKGYGIAEYKCKQEGFTEMIVNRIVDKSLCETYGYTIEDPVELWDKFAVNRYLRNLRYNGEEVQAIPFGVWHNSNNYKVRKYDIYLWKGIFRKKREKIASIYINVYSNAIHTVAPKGFTLNESMMNVGSVLGLTRNDLYGKRE